MFAVEIRGQCIQRHREYLQWRWHVDEVFVKINGETNYLWRAADHKGEIFESFVAEKRYRRAAPRFSKTAKKRFGRPKAIVTDRLRSYRAALREIGDEAHQETGRWFNNRAENSHQPSRRRERAMTKIRSPATLQEFTSIPASVHNHFSRERHLWRRNILKQNRSAALSEWQSLCAA